MKYLDIFLGLALSIGGVLSAATVQLKGETSDADGTTIVGSTASNVDSFTGIPFGAAPVGNLRLKPPQAFVYNGTTIQATGIPTGCPQFISTAVTSKAVVDHYLSGLARAAAIDANSTTPRFGEDCLNLNVQRPSTATADSKLPVVFWMFGGGFELGSTQTFDATQLINTSVAQGKDVIYVATNYRLGGFGFLAGQELTAEGSVNLGLLDQRLALQWVADNIAAFGGDPAKVTIWGESAGSISVFSQMSLYDGNNTYKGAPLFRGAIMDSGIITPTFTSNSSKPQAIFDTVVAASNCTGTADTLACLRAAPYDVFLKAANSVPGIAGYNSVALSYLPRPDGVIFTESPELLIAEGKFAQVPFILGDQEDEGTVFALVQTNLTTTADLEEYLSTTFFTGASTDIIQQLVASYPDDPAAGSPFDTGTANVLYPQYKRLAALLGDATFTLTRRSALSNIAAKFPDLKTYSYLNTYGYGTPTIGTSHGSDVNVAYGAPSLTPAGTTIQTYYLSFINSMDPNPGAEGLPAWPTWKDGNNLMNFTADGKSTLLPDTFRNESYVILTSNVTAFRF